MSLPDPSAEMRVRIVESVPTAVVRVDDVPLSSLEQHFDAIFGTAFPQLFGTGVAPAGPPFALYTCMRFEGAPSADLEIGFPLTEPLTSPVDAGEHRIVASELPAGEVAVISYFGGYDGLGDAWDRFTNEISEAGKRPGTPFWEVYVTEPTPDADPSTLRTDLYCAV